MTLRSQLVPIWAIIAAMFSGALMVVDSAEAQYAPAFGYGGWGSSYAWMGATGGMGMSPFGPVNPAAQAAQNQMRYQVQNAQAAQAFQQAQFMQQKAAAAATQNQQQLQPLQERYNARTGAAVAGQAGSNPSTSGPPINQLLNSNGKPQWPAGTTGDRELISRRGAAEEAIAAVFQEYQAKGHASVSSVADAKQKLADYGHPALKQTSARNRSRTHALLSYLQNLDRALDTMGGLPE